MCVFGVKSDDKLIGHIAFSNSMHKSLEDGCKAAFIFKAENAYISPNWYPTKVQHHRHVPTWNYQVVHMHGELYFKHSDKEKIAAVGLLTQLHERRLNGDNAWKMRDAPTDYIKTKLDQIVGIEFHINRLEAKSKLSQNREKSDYTEPPPLKWSAPIVRKAEDHRWRLRDPSPKRLS